ncbi:MAG: FkbM family methyltransferase [Chitinophagaceae bacterium]|nr:FkbM family methyltransferase [Chitinophagaceae bacterium]
MLKNWTQIILQKILGFQNYLFVFAAFTIYRIRNTKYDQEFLHFLSMVPDNGVIIDIGANIGITTIPLSKHLPNSQIAAIEPIPHNVRTLKKIIRFFGSRNVIVFPMAVGDHNGRINMITPVINHVKKQGLSHVVGAIPDEPATQQGEEFSVPVMRLDDIKELQQLGHISAIKIDVEQFEYAVISGGLQLINRFKPMIYCELWDTPQRKIFLDFMEGIGYEVSVYEKGELVPYDQRPALNFFLLPKSV